MRVYSSLAFIVQKQGFRSMRWLYSLYFPPYFPPSANICSQERIVIGVLPAPQCLWKHTWSKEVYLVKHYWKHRRDGGRWLPIHPHLNHKSILFCYIRHLQRTRPRQPRRPWRWEYRNWEEVGGKCSLNLELEVHVLQDAQSTNCWSSYSRLFL